MSLTLLVIYRKSTGEILSTQSGGTFRFRKQLESLYPDIPPKDLNFYYEETDTLIAPGEDKIILQGPGIPPLLVDHQNNPKAFNQFIINQAAAIKTKPILAVNCEYGMGDQLLSLEAIASFSKLYPDHPVHFRAHPDYLALLKYVQPQPTLTLLSTPQDPQHEFLVTLNPLHRLWDPRAPKNGKADFYAAHLGLQKSTEQIRIMPLPHPLNQPTPPIGPRIPHYLDPLLTIHTKSASRTASTWSPRKALEVAKIWTQNTGGHTYLCGTLPDWAVHPDTTFTMPLSTPWTTTAYLIQHSAYTVCIDSGPMHIARTSYVPATVLWGGSGPNDILGRDPGPKDIRAPFDCINNLCPSCRKPPPTCMDWISPETVLQNIFDNYPQERQHL